MAKAVLFDSTRCVGCRACEEACSKRWELPYNDETAQQERLSENKLTTIRTYGERYSRKLCMHCIQPSCASACPVGALEKTALGPVVYHEDRCIGCRYCMVACPFQVPVYEWSRRLPRVKKCDMCFDRRGLPTTCSEACPTGATITGDREALIAEARRRIRENPDQYYDRVYGVTEAGGTSVLMLASVPLEQLGMPADLGGEPLPQLTWKALSHVPDVISMGSILLGGVWWITHRRDEVAATEKRDKQQGRKPQ